MFSLRFFRTGTLLCLTSVLIAGCGFGDSRPPAAASESASSVESIPAVSTPPSDEEEWKVEELPYAYSTMQQNVVIQLNGEPSLHSPIRTIVGIDAQAYTLFFREPMERASVEKAIRNHIKPELIREGLDYLEPALQFHWVHDQQLHVLVSLPAEKTSVSDWMEYRLHVAGATTVKGTSLPEDSPDFYAVALRPGQVWKVAADGKEREKLTDFTTYYVTEMLDAEARFFLLSRNQRYCECDAIYPKLFSVYDSNTDTITRYPVDLAKHYRGEGNFIADRRGFFYAKPDDGVTVPESEFATGVRVDGYVHGASFSLDRTRLLMAVGGAEQKKDLDLIVYDLEAGIEERRLPGVIRGTIPTSEMDGSILTISFADDGRQATFFMRKNEQELIELRYRYDWKTGTVSDWNPPVPADAWSGYTQTDDGMYQMYPNAGIFKGSEAVLEFLGDGLWIPGSHQFVYTQYEDSSEGQVDTQSLYMFDADRKQERVLSTGLPASSFLIGASKDGNWLYLYSSRDLASPPTPAP
ncbi:hypothetical protein [Brevibacillus sp. AY1]|uniref:hypothetical protein n=1 Tax=Brevibacillus sp. AY1 TaxID=2807621 RepID=UPI002458158D|nr:hypothetical protein [Brevibacillus sp. AY1]MDH4616637.1 hypothetical protein [Brevibacillus sp. AY1]